MVKTVIKCLQGRSKDWMINQTFQEELAQILLKIYYKIKKEHYQTHFTKQVLPRYQNLVRTQKLMTNFLYEHRQQNF